MLIVLAAIFVAEAILQNFVGLPVFQLLALDPTRLSVATAWQLFTHVLVLPPVPEAMVQLSLSVLFIWWIVAPFEDRYGRTRVIQLTVASALTAALPAVLVGQVLPSTFVFGPQTITLSAMCASAMLLPSYAELSFFGLFVMRPKQLIYVVAAWSLVHFLTSKNGAQLAADLGAISGGVGFAKLWMQRAPRKKIPSGPKGKKGLGRESGRIRLVKNDDDDSNRWLN